MEQHVTSEHKVESGICERELGSVTLLERDTGGIARVGRRLGDQGGIILKAYPGGVRKVLGKHASRVALTASKVEKLGNGVARDAIEDLASERVQHLSQQPLPAGRASARSQAWRTWVSPGVG